MNRILMLENFDTIQTERQRSIDPATMMCRTVMYPEVTRIQQIKRCSRDPVIQSTWKPVDNGVWRHPVHRSRDTVAHSNATVIRSGAQGLMQIFHEKVPVPVSDKSQTKKSAVA